MFTLGNCPILPTIPSGCMDFTIDMPRMQQYELVPHNPGALSFRNLISHINRMSPIHQRTLNDLWEFDYSGDFVGFTYKGKRIMRCIADCLRQIHLAGMYYLDLFDKTFVQLPNFNIYFPYVPLTAPTDDQNATLMWGISNDSSQFRLLVSFLISSTHPQPVLSIDFRLFFSEIFTNGMNSAHILEQVREYSFYQLYHPITFDDSLDRLRFVHLIVQYRNDDKPRFDFDRDLEKQEYELLLWKNSFPPTHFLYKMMRRAINKSFGKRRPGTLHAPTIPKFIRNVHHHYTEATTQLSHEEVDAILNEAFPGICTKLLDWILRSFSEHPNRFRLRLSTLLESKPFGFKSS